MSTNKCDIINYNIAIIGIGFVGSAMMNSFQQKGYILNKNLFCYDKFKNEGLNTFEDTLNTDMIFLALPTMYDESKREYNKDAIYSVCEKLKKNKYNGAVIIKSTVEPETTQKLSEDFNLNFIHNPEFLTARTAAEDFHNQKHIVLGKSNTCSDKNFNKVHMFYKQSYPDSDISLCDSTESESMKIFVNCFYSVKIQFFNELYLLCEKININYDNVKDLMLKNNWINSNHTTVPGPDGKLSYGGLCFPKDTNALLKYMESNDTPHEVLKATIKERNIMRNDNDNIIKKNNNYEAK
jgi:UDPglucose 6-dehydrogenase